MKTLLDDPQHAEGSILTAELTSSEARNITLRVDPPGKSKYDVLRKELVDRLSKHA